MEILGLKNSEFGVVAAVAIGYRSAGDKYAKNKKVRFLQTKKFKSSGFPFATRLRHLCPVFAPVNAVQKRKKSIRAVYRKKL